MPLQILIFLYLIFGLFECFFQPRYQHWDQSPVHNDVHVHFANDSSPRDSLAGDGVAKGSVWIATVYGLFRDRPAFTIQSEMDISRWGNSTDRAVSVDDSEKWALYIFENDILGRLGRSRNCHLRSFFGHGFPPGALPIPTNSQISATAVPIVRPWMMRVTAPASMRQSSEVSIKEL